MERRRKIPFQNRQVDGIEVPVNSSKETWNEYLLEDGTVIRTKVVTTDIVRLEGEYDGEGNPVYVMKSTTVSSVSAPETLRKKAT